MRRRHFLQYSVGALGAAGLGGAVTSNHATAAQQEFFPTPTFSLTPVVGDGKWIWTKPPTDQTGYLEPRTFELSIGMELQGTSAATGIRATTVTPVKQPEQEVKEFKIETDGCEAALRAVSNEAAQLFIAAPSIAAGQIIRAVAKYRIKISKEFHNYQQDQFPATQKLPKDFARQYLTDGPGIQVRDKAVQSLAKTLMQSDTHPWQQAKSFHAWVWENIQARPGAYTNVLVALRDKKGDCEERASVFVALCRAAGIPARLVWVPNHNWAEFWLHDDKGQGHWIPAHTSCYAWFGWTGAHELVLQKGDNLKVPEERKGQRLLADWMQWQGGRPKVRYIAELAPVADKDQSDAGPGARSKDARGAWLLVNKHADDKYMRQG